MVNHSHTVPEPLYEAIPYVYFAIGLGVMLVFQNIWGVLSGIAWLSAGASVVAMRITYRRACREPNATDAAGSNNERTLQVHRLDSGSLQLVWSKAYESGNLVIDEQHRGLFDTANALLEAFHDNRLNPGFEMLFDTLIEDIKSHFSTEEELLECFEPSLADAHKSGHGHLVARALVLREQARKQSLIASDMLGFLVNDLMLQHITQDDRKFFRRL